MVLPYLQQIDSMYRQKRSIISSIPIKPIYTGYDRPEFNRSSLLCCGYRTLVITKGMMGWRPVFGGVAFVEQHAMVYVYFFIPAAIVTEQSTSVGWCCFQNY